MITNTVGRATRMNLGDRECVVAPVTLLVEGVLNGSRGPLYYPREEIKQNVIAWNGIPLTLGHPDLIMSARTPEILSQYQLGVVLNAEYAYRKLTAQAWFDVVACNRIDKRIIAKLERGEPIEVSTGILTHNELVDGVYNNKAYIGIARNYRPDHLAVLLDEYGACSVDDGCGVFNQHSLKERLLAVC